jgi:ribosome-associated translation inhibitor RaiA
MQVEIRGQGVELSESARERLGRRLDFALGRLGRNVSRVWVHLAGEDGRDVGVEKRCRVLVRMPDQPDVLVEGKGQDVNRLIARTVNRAGLAARKHLGGQH